MHDGGVDAAGGRCLKTADISHISNHKQEAEIAIVMVHSFSKPTSGHTSCSISSHILILPKQHHQLGDQVFKYISL